MVVVLVLLLLASAIISGSEVALFSLDGSVKETLAEAEDQASRRVLALLEKPHSLLITILLLNTFVNVSAAILAALITERMASGLALSQTVVFILEVIVLTFVLLVVSEITPKLIAKRHATTYSRIVSAPLMVLHKLLRPISSVLARAMRFVQSRFKPRPPPPLSSEDIKAMAEIGEAHGTFEEEERELIHSIVEFGDTSARAIMINRLDIVALPVTATLAEAIEIIRTSSLSRLPLYVDHLDNILGMIYAKDLLPYLKNGNGVQRIDWTSLMRPTMFVPMGRKLDDLLKDFQRKKTHLAIVVDEYGGTAGMVTLEDVLEEVVGDMRDELDEAESDLYEKLGEDRFRIDARIDLDDLNDLLALDFDTESFDFETLGGLIFHLTGNIPSEGEEMVYDRLSMRVETVENNRIRHVHVQVKPLVEDKTLPEKRAAENP